MKILSISVIERSHRENSKDRLVILLKTNKGLHLFYRSSGTGAPEYAKEGDWIPFVDLTDTYIFKKEKNKQAVESQDKRIVSFLNRQNSLEPSIIFKREIGWSNKLKQWAESYGYKFS